MLDLGIPSIKQAGYGQFKYLWVKAGVGTDRWLDIAVEMWRMGQSGVVWTMVNISNLEGTETK